MTPKSGKCYKSKWRAVTSKIMCKKIKIWPYFSINLGDYFFPVFLCILLCMTLCYNYALLWHRKLVIANKQTYHCTVPPLLKALICIFGSLILFGWQHLPYIITNTYPNLYELILENNPPRSSASKAHFHLWLDSSNTLEIEIHNISFENSLALFHVIDHY